VFPGAEREPMIVQSLRSDLADGGRGMDRALRGTYPISPLVIMAVTWGVSLVVALTIVDAPERYGLTHHFIGLHDLDLAAFSLPSGLRLGLLGAVFVLGYVVAGRGLPWVQQPGRVDLDPEFLVRTLWWVNLVFLGITAIWVYVTARQLGGISGLIFLVRQDAYLAREVLLDNKLFTGMRLFYAALPATACLAAAVLAVHGKADLSRRALWLCRAILILNLVVLALLPIVMSQRLILLQLVVSCYVAASMARGRLLAFWLIPLAVGVFFLVWVLHEAVTNPDLAQSASEIALHKLSFYIINDLWNSFRPMQGPIDHTYGLFSLQFAMFFSLTDTYLLDLMSEPIMRLEEVRGGGEFSLLSAPYVDFGFFGAAIYLLLVGAGVRIAYHRANGNVMWAAIYGQVANALVLSVHVNFFGSQDFVFAIMVIVLISLWSRFPQRAVARGR
jgi:oligosaccharide repeat unit polymerase